MYIYTYMYIYIYIYMYVCIHVRMLCTKYTHMDGRMDALHCAAVTPHRSGPT